MIDASDANGDDDTTSENEIILQKFQRECLSLGFPWGGDHALNVIFHLKQARLKKQRLRVIFPLNNHPSNALQCLTNLEIGQFKKYHNWPSRKSKKQYRRNNTIENPKIIQLQIQDMIQLKI